MSPWERTHARTIFKTQFLQMWRQKKVWQPPIWAIPAMWEDWLLRYIHSEWIEAMNELKIRTQAFNGEINYM